MTLIAESDLDTIKMNHHAKYLEQSSFCSKLLSRQTHSPDRVR